MTLGFGLNSVLAEPVVKASDAPARGCRRRRPRARTRRNPSCSVEVRQSLDLFARAEARG